MSTNQTEEYPLSARSEIIYVNHQESDKKSSNQSQRKIPQRARSASLRSTRPTASAHCAECKLPLLIEVNAREMLNKSRASAIFQSERLCKVCNKDKSKNGLSPASRLFKSDSINWPNMGDKIETWFEKARTPDQRVVYNFLEKLNTEENKPTEKPAEAPQAKNLDDVLNNLKKYQTRFNSPRPRNKFSRVFESSSWRVMRHPTASYQFSRYNQAYGDEASRDIYVGSTFASTDRKMRSTYLIHPNWV